MTTDLRVWHPSDAPLPARWIVAALDASVSEAFEPDHEPNRLRYRVTNPAEPVTEEARAGWISNSIETWTMARLWKDGAPNPAAVPQDIHDAYYWCETLVERLDRAGSAAEDEWQKSRE